VSASVMVMAPMMAATQRRGRDQCRDQRARDQGVQDFSQR